jgi:hypothetical protein
MALNSLTLTANRDKRFITFEAIDRKGYRVQLSRKCFEAPSVAKACAFMEELHRLIAALPMKRTGAKTKNSSKTR